MADEELEAGEGGKKSPILAYILIWRGCDCRLGHYGIGDYVFRGVFRPRLCRAD